jgi:serine/threonine protein kinase
MSTLSSGQRLSARYTARERLKAGSTGDIWRAHDVLRERDVVIKLLRAEFEQRPEAIAVLRAEFAAAAALPRPAAAHWTIASGYALERDSGRWLLVRDYIEGHDLSCLRAEDWRSIVSPAAQVAEALAALHARGLVHRDLKSSNVILKPDGTICLIDLGAAVLKGAGSPYSASPQQYQGEPPSSADDAYAFGVLLYELLSGYPPFYPNITRERVLAELPAPAKSLRPIPRALQDLVLQLLAKNPLQRPQGMEQVALMLREMPAANE